MPNAILTKADGLITSIPADSVVAILSTALDAPNPEKPELRSIVMTTYRGLSSTSLAHTGADAAVEIEKARTAKRGALRMSKPKAWIVLQVGDDQTRLLPGSVPGYEVVKVGEAERLRLFWKPEGGEIVPLDVDNSEANRAAIDADIEGKA